MIRLSGEKTKEKIRSYYLNLGHDTLVSRATALEQEYNWTNERLKSSRESESSKLKRINELEEALNTANNKINYSGAPKTKLEIAFVDCEKAVEEVIMGIGYECAGSESDSPLVCLRCNAGEPCKHSRVVRMTIMTHAYMFDEKTSSLLIVDEDFQDALYTRVFHVEKIGDTKGATT